MAFTKEQIQPYLGTENKPYTSPLIRAEKYLDRDVPEGYFVVQDWCMAQGFAPVKSGIPDLSRTFQGLEYIFQTATGKEPEDIVLSESAVANMMHYLNRENDFENGALRQFPEYQRLIKQELLKLPNGRKTIDAIQKIPKYKDLFKDQPT